VAAATNDIRPDDLLEIETIARNTPSYVTLLTPSRSSPATETRIELLIKFLQLLVKLDYFEQDREWKHPL